MIKWISSTFVFLAIVWIGALNTKPLTISLLPEDLGFQDFYKIETYLFLVVVISCFIGIIFGCFLEYLRGGRTRSSLKEKNYHLQEMKRRLERLEHTTDLDDEETLSYLR